MERRTPGQSPPVDGDKRRIVACLAACEGISTEALEDGIILKLVAACVHIQEQRIAEILHAFGHIRQPTPKPPRKLAE